ncbi:hypothetical protein D3C85_1277580 [compost metagenome]
MALLPATSACMVQLSGSIGAWARYGRRYSASITFAAPLSEASMPSSGFATVPGCVASLLYWSNSAAVLTVEPLSSQTISSASRAVLAGQ